MCFQTEMRDILTKQKPVPKYNADWLVEDLLLSYKYDYRDRFFRDLHELKKVLPGIVYHILEDIGERHFNKEVIL